MSTADCNLDTLQLRRELGAPYDGPHAQNAISFLDEIIQHSSELSCALQHTLGYLRCSLIKDFIQSAEAVDTGLDYGQIWLSNRL